LFTKAAYLASHSFEEGKINLTLLYRLAVETCFRQAAFPGSPRREDVGTNFDDYSVGAAEVAHIGATIKSRATLLIAPALVSPARSVAGAQLEDPSRLEGSLSADSFKPGPTAASR